DQQKAALIAAQASATLRHMELHDELESQLREAMLVHRFAVQAGSARSVNDIAWYLLESIRSRMQVDRASVYLSDASSRGTLTPVAHFPSRAADWDRTATTGEIDLTVQLSYGEALVGYVELHRTASQPFTARDTRIAETIAHQAAVAIQNLRLREESGKASTYRELDR